LLSVLIIIGFSAWVIGLAIRHVAIKKVKLVSPKLYKYISQGESTWLEKKYYSPFDGAITFRLHKVISRNPRRIISSSIQQLYKYSMLTFAVCSIFIFGYFSYIFFEFFYMKLSQNLVIP